MVTFILSKENAASLSKVPRSSSFSILIRAASMFFILIICQHTT